MNNTQFSSSFKFRDYRFEKYRYADRRSGAEYHYIAYLRQGTCQIQSRSSTLELSAGDLFYLPMNLSYESYWTGSDAIRFASFGFTFFPNPEQRRYPLQKIKHDDTDMQLVEQIAASSENSGTAIFQFYELLARLLPKMIFAPSEPSQSILHQAEHYLQENPFVQIRDVAKHCNMSESGLYAVFKRLSDHSPNELRQKVLISKALALLEETDISIEDISSTLQFSSPSYFRKVFKKHTGTTPSQIRKQSSL